MDTDINLIFIYLALMAFAFSFFLNRILVKFSKNLGKRNSNENLIRWAEESKPSLGGITFFIVFLLTFSAYATFFQETRISPSEQFGIFAAIVLAFIMGLSDDAYNTTPILKLMAQITCGIILVFTGNYINISPTPFFNYALTVFWVVAVMNSINMLDNMDGIATITSIFILGCALSIALIVPQQSVFYIFIILGVLMALVGFLFYNWHPSKMFMGDAGSQFLGLFLAAIGIKYFWNNTDIHASNAVTKQILLTALAFIIPISDTATVIINRLGRGQSPFIGGKDHTTHHLSYLGLSDRQVAWVFIGISCISLLLIYIMVKFLSNWSHVFTTIFNIYFIGVFSLLYSTTQSKKAKKVFNERNH